MTTIDEYRRMLPVSRHGLDDALETHADTMERIGAQCVERERRARELKDELARTEARILAGLRETAAPKTTVGELESAVVRDRDRVRAFGSYEAARADWQAWERLYDAWKSRDFAARKLADLYGDGYFARGPVVDRAQRDTARAELRQAVAETGGRRRLS